MPINIVFNKNKTLEEMNSMKAYRKILAIVVSLVVMISLFACGAKKEASTVTGDKIYKIGTLQLVQHQALDASYQGFVDYLNENGVKFSMDYQNASGEQSAC